jgi:hypothetical protein
MSSALFIAASIVRFVAGSPVGTSGDALNSSDEKRRLSLLNILLSTQKQLIKKF